MTDFAANVGSQPKTRPPTPKRQARRTTQSSERPTLRFTPTAWAKLAFLRDAGPTEIGGFGISTRDDLLLVEDVQLVAQSCDWASVAFDDAAVAEFFDSQVDAGRQPAQFARVWVHTHPGNSPQPSLTDEETFARAFGDCDWAVMFILARGGSSYARLQFGVGPRGALEIPVVVDYSGEFPASDWATWLAEYEACVTNIAHDIHSDPLESSLHEEREPGRDLWPPEAFWRDDRVDFTGEGDDDLFW
jgi:proteasome lid subunit RPN8/RPN11